MWWKVGALLVFSVVIAWYIPDVDMCEYESRKKCWYYCPKED